MMDENLWTVEDVERIAGNSRFMRHFLFARYILGESLIVALQVAIDNRRRPLPVAAMRHIAAGWNQEDSSGE